MTGTPISSGTRSLRCRVCVPTIFVECSLVVVLLVHVLVQCALFDMGRGHIARRCISEIPRTNGQLPATIFSRLEGKSVDLRRYSLSSNPRERGCSFTRSCQGNRLGIGLMRSNRVRARTIPKGLRPPAQGCEERATLGKRRSKMTTATRLRPCLAGHVQSQTYFSSHSISCLRKSTRNSS